jgi:hypothetical protein
VALCPADEVGVGDLPDAVRRFVPPHAGAGDRCRPCSSERTGWRPSASARCCASTTTCGPRRRARWALVGWPCTRSCANTGCTRAGPPAVARCPESLRSPSPTAVGIGVRLAEGALMTEVAVYTSARAARSLWQRYRVYADRVELGTLFGRMIVPRDRVEGGSRCGAAVGRRRGQLRWVRGLRVPRRPGRCRRQRLPGREPAVAGVPAVGLKPLRLG